MIHTLQATNHNRKHSMFTTSLQMVTEYEKIGKSSYGFRVLKK